MMCEKRFGHFFTVIERAVASSMIGTNTRHYLDGTTLFWNSQEAVV